MLQVMVQIKILSLSLSLSAKRLTDKQTKAVSVHKGVYFHAAVLFNIKFANID